MILLTPSDRLFVCILCHRFRNHCTCRHVRKCAAREQIFAGQSWNFTATKTILKVETCVCIYYRSAPARFVWLMGWNHASAYRVRKTLKRRRANYVANCRATINPASRHLSGTRRRTTSPICSPSPERPAMITTGTAMSFKSAERLTPLGRWPPSESFSCPKRASPALRSGWWIIGTLLLLSSSECLLLL